MFGMKHLLSISRRLPERENQEEGEGEKKEDQKTKGRKEGKDLISEVEEVLKFPFDSVLLLMRSNFDPLMMLMMLMTFRALMESIRWKI